MQARSNATTLKTEFPGHGGEMLAARLDIPAGPLRATALFAHCFTCSKDLLAAKRIAGELARLGIAVLRFDFTGAGCIRRRVFPYKLLVQPGRPRDCR